MALRDAAKLQKRVLTSNSLFRLSRDEEYKKLRRHKPGFPATTRLLIDPPSVSQRYVLTGTFKTDGQVLHLTAFDTRRSKPRSKSSAQENVEELVLESEPSADQMLRNIDKVFPDLHAVSKCFSDARKVTVIAVDLGERFTAVACCINCATEPNDVENGIGVRNLSLKHTALYQPSMKAQNGLERHKPAKVLKAEQSILSNKDCA
jgi:hypothetical protein